MEHTTPTSHPNNKQHDKDNVKPDLNSPEQHLDTPLMEQLLKPEGDIDPNQMTPNRPTNKFDFGKVFSMHSDKRKGDLNMSQGKNPFSNFVSDSESQCLGRDKGYGQNAAEGKEEDEVLVLEEGDEYLVKFEEEERRQLVKLEESILIQQQEEPQMERFYEEYEEILRQIVEEGGPRDTELPVFWKQGQRSQASKLLNYNLNAKNSRNVVYDTRKRTCHSYYKCQGCEKVMVSASALGGHLSSCQFKARHYQIVSQMELAAKSRRCRKLEKEALFRIVVSDEDKRKEEDQDQDEQEVEAKRSNRAEDRRRMIHKRLGKPLPKSAPRTVGETSPYRAKIAPSTPATQEVRYDLRRSPRNRRQ